MIDICSINPGHAVVAVEGSSQWSVDSLSTEGKSLAAPG